MLLVVTYSTGARGSLRNSCRAEPSAVVRRFGRVALFRETELGALLALRLRAKHGDDVQLERTEPLNEFADVPARVRDAAQAYEARDHPSTSYANFVAGTDHPSAEALHDVEL
ncbi:Uncharacterized protein HSRCO_0192 [Halanaeroarchaeum sp. HSR-CO]|uniref:DUF7855 family protein n=1 Tax=Halanaeroarchaeum sp. HSR-CO TaxID=2866382 RepID=UPI00217D1B9B|nr:hypothetical protein [Halanaeroarchaeum sp. HSR-CO]UWG46494.1 Uncharacterized protein HSRCO_0192 [Halanaeroarchaeum sp. HSR-CO]